jgi:hypothetical protein
MLTGGESLSLKIVVAAYVARQSMAANSDAGLPRFARSDEWMNGSDPN